MTAKLTYAQRMERLKIAHTFKEDTQLELMAKQAKDPAYLQSLDPKQRLTLSRYLENKRIAQEVAEEAESEQK